MSIQKVWNFSLPKLIADALPDVIDVTRKINDQLRSTGICEVLTFEATLGLGDPSGGKAIYSKKQRVTFLQNNICKTYDPGWGQSSQHK